MEAGERENSFDSLNSLYIINSVRRFKGFSLEGRKRISIKLFVEI